MGYPICDICDKGMGFDGDHVCDPENIKKFVDDCQKRAREAENKLDNIRNSILMLLQSLPSFGDGEVSVDTDWIRKIWNAAECRDYDAKTPESFLVQWLATHGVLCEAFSLFRTEEIGRRDNTSTLEKLQALRKACDEAKEILYKNDGSPFDLTAENILES